MRKALFGFIALTFVISGCQSPKPDVRPMPRPQRPVKKAPPVPPPSRPDIIGRPPPGDPGWFPRASRMSNRWSTIVVHHSATDRGSARTFDRYHKDKGWDELGYHFVIGNGSETPDGMIEVGARWNKQKHGAHCKTADNYFNEHGIGICLVGDFTKSRPTARQMAALERLTAFLCATCHIPPDHVVTHGAVTRKTACPGRNLSIAEVRRAVAASVTTAAYSKRRSGLPAS